MRVHKGLVLLAVLAVATARAGDEPRDPGHVLAAAQAAFASKALAATSEAIATLDLYATPPGDTAPIRAWLAGEARKLAARAKSAQTPAEGAKAFMLAVEADPALGSSDPALARATAKLLADALKKQPARNDLRLRLGRFAHRTRMRELAVRAFKSWEERETRAYEKWLAGRWLAFVRDGTRIPAGAATASSATSPGATGPGATGPGATIEKSGESFPTLAAALEKAQAGDRVLVRPGTYKEQVKVIRAIELVAQGKPGEVVVDHPDALVFSAAKGLISGITFINSGPGIRDRNRLVWCGDGKVTLENCSFFATGQIVIITDTRQSEPLFRNCQIRGKDCTAISAQQGHITLEGCEIAAEGAGTFDNQWGLVTLRRCKIDNGISHEQVPLVMEGCEIEGTAANPTGVSIYQRGEATLSDCTFRHVDISGRGLSRIAIQNCRLEPGTVSTTQNTTCTVKGSRFTGPLRGAAVEVTGLTTVEGCEISGVGRGLMLTGDGPVSIENCRIKGTTEHGVQVVGTGPVRITGCTITGSGKEGIAFGKQTLGTTTNCTLTANKGGAFLLDPTAKVTRTQLIE